MRLDYSRARGPDLPELVQLVNSAYRGESSKLGWTTEAELLSGQRIDHEMLREAWSDPGKVLLVGRPASGEIQACVLIERQNAELAHLGLLTVAPGLQDKGLGRELLGYAESYVTSRWGATSVEMTVISLRRELIAWYERRGYELTGERRPFPMGEPRFGVPVVGELEFVVLRKLVKISAKP
jgi:ribosomal protein S18 acetylase RimI-like enzyme